MGKSKKLMQIAAGTLLACQLFIGTAYARPDWPSDTGIVAEGGVVFDADSGTMIFGQNSRVAYPPASITKLLTALVVVESTPLDEMVTFSDDAVNNVESGSGNALKLTVGDQLTVEDCLYALLLRSSNQAANALAEHVGGSRAGFVEMMNQKIAELGCTGSHFKNPSGLNDSEQLVTPYDMALIAREAFADESLRKIASTKKYSLPATILNPEGITFSVEHRLLKTTDPGDRFYYPGAMAGKTGYTSVAGNTLVTYAERDGRKLIAVVLKGGQPQYYVDTITLLDFGFDRFKNEDIASLETAYTTGDTDVAIGETSYAPSDLEIRQPAVITLPKEASFEDAEKTLDTNLPEHHPDGAVAVIRYTYNERRVGEAYLCLKQAEVPAGTVDSPAENAETTQPMSTAPADDSHKGGSTDKTADDGSRNGGITKILLQIIVVVLIAVALAGFYVVRERKQEEKARQLRRERRRKRLLESGVSEEEFEKLVEERRRK